MSLTTIPDSYLALAHACGPKIDIEAICTEGLAVVGEFVWGTEAGVEFYADFAADCTNAGGGGCPGPGKDAPQPNSANTRGLYAWGYRLDSRNNRITWTNSGAPFVIDHIEIATSDLDPPIALGSGAAEVFQGVGVCPAWEWGNQAAYAKMREQMVLVVVGSNDPLDLCLFPEYDEEAQWYDGGNTAPTPVDVSSDVAGLTNRVVGTGDAIAFRLYPLVWHGDGSDLPDTIYAPLRIRIWGSPA